MITPHSPLATCRGKGRYVTDFGVREGPGQQMRGLGQGAGAAAVRRMGRGVHRRLHRLGDQFGPGGAVSG